MNYSEIRKPLIFWLLVLFNLLSTYIYGNSHNNFYFRSFEVEDGLSQNMVYSILQDKQGFMWFGTQDGLNRYDGENFRIYKKVASDPTSIGSNAIFSLMQNTSGTIWVGTLNGVSLYNPRCDRFTHLDLKTSEGENIDGIIRDMKEDKDGNIWLVDSNKGIFCVFPNKKLKFFPIKNPTTAINVNVRKIAFDASGNLWIATSQDGLFKLNIKTGETNQFVINKDLSVDAIYDLFLLNAETLLVGTENRGLQSFSLSRHTFSPLLEKGSDGKSLFVRHIFRDKSERLWLGTESGIYIYNLQTKQIETIQHVFNDPYSISDNAIYSIYQDREGGMWIGTYFGGVNYFTESYAQFEKFYPLKGANSISGKCISEFCQDEQQNIWIGTEDAGLNRFNLREKSFEQGFVPASNIHALLIDNNELWVGTFSSGLYVIDLKTKKVRSYKSSLEDNSLNSNDIYSIYRDYSGTMWVGTTLGLNIYDEDNNCFKRIKKSSINRQVNDILEDNKGILWFATLGNGLFTFDKLNNKWVNYKSPIEKDNVNGEMITCLLEDANHQVWIATEGAGLCMYNRDSNSFTNIYNTENGLPNNVIYKLIEDENGDIWGSTNKGLFKLNPKTGNILTYTHYDGLPGDQFNYKSGFKSNDGKIYFGLTKGFISFYPNRIQANTPPASIVISSFQIFNKEVIPGAKDSLLRQSITYTKEINLPYNLSVFSLGFSVLNYASSKKYLCAYKLEGRDKDWINTEQLHRITYSGLSPGEYIFQIKVSNGKRGWSNNDSLLKINVLPPLYRTNLAYSLYIILIGLFIFFSFKTYLERLKRRNNQILHNLEERKEKELYHSKIEFFTNITHEIRTPLSLIKAPLEEVIKKLSHVDPNWENLSIIQRNTNRLLKLVNELLDFRKTESKGLSLNFINIDVIAIIKETVSRFIPSAQLKEIDIKLELDKDEFFADVDPEIFTKILSNIFNNALKHAKNEIIVHFCLIENKFKLTVTNDGNIVPHEFADWIFEPFSKLNDNLPGTGLGLPLSKLLIELHNGVIYLDKEVPKTSFVIELPVKQDRVIQLINKDIESTNLEMEKTSNLSKINDLLRIDESITILSVEDNKEFQYFLAKQLSENYQVLKAQNGIQALEILSTKNVDVIISDIMMPDMDGMTLCGKIKNNLKYSHIPFILLTAQTTLGSKMDGLKIGADEYIEKPYSIDFLRARIDNLLENRKKVQESFKNSPEINFETIVHSNTDKNFLNKLVDEIHSHFEDVDLDVDKLASAMNMSRATFYRKVKGISELTPNDFIRLIRLKKATELLREKNYPINEIAFIVGFSSSSYFSKCFFKQFGILPKDFK